jgi:hypothetical protein
VRGLTAKTRTPPHYVLGEIVNASGDALIAAESGLVAKARDAMRRSERRPRGHHAPRVPRDRRHERAKITDSETIWRNPEFRSEAQAVDAASSSSSSTSPTRCCGSASA